MSVGYHRCIPSVRDAVARAIWEAWEDLLPKSHVGHAPPTSIKDPILTGLRERVFLPLLREGMEVSDLPAAFVDGTMICPPKVRGLQTPRRLWSAGALERLPGLLETEAFAILDEIHSTFGGPPILENRPAPLILLERLHGVLEVHANLPSLAEFHPHRNPLLPYEPHYLGPRLQRSTLRTSQVEYLTHDGEVKTGTLVDPDGDRRSPRLEWRAVGHSLKRSYWEGVPFPNYRQGTARVQTSTGVRTVAWTRLRFLEDSNA